MDNETRMEVCSTVTKKQSCEIFERKMRPENITFSEMIQKDKDLRFTHMHLLPFNAGCKPMKTGETL